MTQTNLDTSSHNGIFNLSELGCLKISGPDAEKLLQGQLSCDLASLTPDSGRMGAHCNPQGRIISLFYIAKTADAFYLIMPKNLVEIAMSALKKYALFFKTELHNSNNTCNIYGMIATDSTQPAANANSAVIKLTSNLNRYILLTLEPNIYSATGSYNEWKLLDMLDGIPAIYAETSGEFLPHDLNLPSLHAVDFNKGCYTGQEIIARMHYRGKPKNHLYRGVAPVALLPGTMLFADDKPAGTIIDSSQTVYNGQYAVLFTSSEMAVANQQLSTEQGHLIAIQKSE